MRLVGLALLGLGVALLTQIGQLYIHSLQHTGVLDVPEPFSCPSVDETAALDRFRRLLTFPSVSNGSAPLHVEDPQVFRDMLSDLEQSYPLVWSSLRVEEVGEGGLSRLFTWPGSRPDLPPVLFVSHYDVVPVTPGTEGEWTHPPFAGQLADGFVWGRGAADIKFSVAALLEAVSVLLRTGFEPRRTILLAFGHDEEVGGSLGAGAVSRLLASRGSALDVVIDEGGVVLLDGMRPFAAGRPVALVGTAEKGYTSVDVRLRSPGGHASMPPTDGSDPLSQLWRLTTALTLLVRAPSQLRAPVTDMLREMAPYAPGWMRPLLVGCEENRSWLANRLLALVFRHGVSRETAAMVTTTLALTRLGAGVADNVLPQETFVRFNSRLLPGEGPEVPEERVRRAARLAGVAAEVAIKQETTWPGSSVTPTSGRHYRKLKRAIQETWREGGQPPVVVAPFLLAGATDSKHYGHLSTGGILRFVPYGMNKTAGELGLIHATNERVRAGHLGRAVCSYVRIMQLFAGEEEEEEQGQGVEGESAEVKEAAVREAVKGEVVEGLAKTETA